MYRYLLRIPVKFPCDIVLITGGLLEQPVILVIDLGGKSIIDGLDHSETWYMMLYFSVRFLPPRLVAKHHIILWP